MRIRPSFFIAALAVSALTACKEEQSVATYTVPKEKDRPAAEAAPAAPAPAATPPMPADAALLAQQTQFPQPAWTAPGHWRTDPPHPMRKGSWTIPGKNSGTAELTVTVFPGDVGGDLANVNRWRRQIGLGPIDPAALAESLRPVTVAGLPGKQVLLQGPQQTVIGVILPRDGATWFFKFTGDAATVEAEKNHIEAFLQTVQFP